MKTWTTSWLIPGPSNEFYVIDHGKTFVSTTDWAANIAAAAGAGRRFRLPLRMLPPFTTRERLPLSVRTEPPRSGERITSNGSRREPTRAGRPFPAPGTSSFSITARPTTIQSHNWSKIPEINPFVNGPAVNGVYPQGHLLCGPARGRLHTGGGLGGGSFRINQSNQIVWTWASSPFNRFLPPVISAAPSGCPMATL